MKNNRANYLCKRSILFLFMVGGITIQSTTYASDPIVEARNNCSDKLGVKEGHWETGTYECWDDNFQTQRPDSECPASHTFGPDSHFYIPRYIRYTCGDGQTFKTQNNIWLGKYWNKDVKPPAPPEIKW